MKKVLLFFLMCVTLGTFAQTWQVMNSGTTNSLRHVQFVNTQIGWAVGGSGNVLKTTDGGITWVKQTVNNSALFIGCYFVDQNTGWVGGDAGVYKTTDGGNTWNVQVGPTGITKLFFINATTGWAVGGTDGSTPYVGDIYKTIDGGATWSHQSKTNDWIRFYDVQFVDANNGWAYAEKNGLMVHTTNGGESWETLTNNTTYLIRGMYFINATTGWLGGRTSSSGVCMKTSNGGTSWSDLVGTINYSVDNMVFIDQNTGWASSSSQNGKSIVKTTDGGTSWTVDYSITTNTAANSLFFLDANHGWAVGENGMILRYVNNTVSAGSIATIDSKLSLVSFPNPFTESAKIQYKVPENGFVVLKIMDVSGKTVKELVNENKQAGDYSCEFKAGNLPSGMYFAKIETNNKTEIIKIQLTK